jgi:hypothetical protein
MLLYSERNAAEAVIARAAGGSMASVNGSGGALVALFAAASAPEDVVAGAARTGRATGAAPHSVRGRA